MRVDNGFNVSTGFILLFIALFYLGLFFASFAIINIKDIWEVIFKPEIIFAIKLSLFTAAGVTVISLIFAVPSAYALSRSRGPFKNLLDVLFDVPISLSPVAMGAMVLMFLNSPPGLWIERHLMRFIFEVPGIILVQTALVLPFSIRIMKSHFDTIPESYELVARTLGYSKTKVFLYVTLPLAKNALLATMLTSFAKALGEFGATVTVAGAISMKTQTLPISIFMSLATADIQKTFVLIFILIFISIINLILIRMIVKKGPSYD